MVADRLKWHVEKTPYRYLDKFRQRLRYSPLALLHKKWLQRCLRSEVSRRRASREPVKVVVGSGQVRPVVGSPGTNYAGWLMTDVGSLDILNLHDWNSIFSARDISKILAEHVFEHLTQDQLRAFLRIVRRFLTQSGSIRIAVPDGFHPDPAYIDYVRPEGSGPGAEDHEVLYNYSLFARILAEEGWECHALEYFDERGEFYQDDWSRDDGFVLRSADHDPRNKEHPLSYTSLILNFRPK